MVFFTSLFSVSISETMVSGSKVVMESSTGFMLDFFFFSYFFFSFIISKAMPSIKVTFKEVIGLICGECYNFYSYLLFGWFSLFLKTIYDGWSFYTKGVPSSMLINRCLSVSAPPWSLAKILIPSRSMISCWVSLILFLKGDWKVICCEPRNAGFYIS